MTPLQQASRNLITQLEGDSVWANYPWVTPKIAELRKALVDEQAQQVAVQDLLESLRSMVEMMDSGDEHGEGSDWYLKAMAALQKFSKLKQGATND